MAWRSIRESIGKFKNTAGCDKPKCQTHADHRFRIVLEPIQGKSDLCSTRLPIVSFVVQCGKRENFPRFSICASVCLGVLLVCRVHKRHSNNKKNTLHFIWWKIKQIFKTLTCDLRGGGRFLSVEGTLTISEGGQACHTPLTAGRQVGQTPTTFGTWNAFDFSFSIFSGKRERYIACKLAEIAEKITPIALQIQ